MTVPGHFKLRLVKKGPWVAAVVFRPCPLEIHVDAPWQWLDRWPRLCAEIDGRSADPERVRDFGRPITQAEYLYMSAAAEWDRRHDPAAPAANPRQAMSLDEMRPLF